MKKEIIMPQMGESVAEGTIIRWLVSEGERVEKDQPIVEISTDKIDTEIPSPVTGILEKIIHGPEETVSVGTVIGIVEAMEEVSPEGAFREKKPEEKKEKVKIEVSPEREERPRLSPLVKRLIKEYGIDISRIKGSGAGGRITRDDVLEYLKKKQALPAEEVPVKEKEIPPEEIRPLSHMRKIIAERMVQSKKNIPHVTTTFEVDMTEIREYRERIREDVLRREGVNITFLPFIVLATISALKKYPVLNSSWSDEGIIIKRYINIGIAVALEDGLIVPVIRDADKKDLIQIAKAIHDLSTRARERKLSVDEIQNGTFTITNYGSGGSIFGTPIIFPPQVGILGVGKVVKRPVVINDAIAIRDMVYLSLSFDHRVIDGAQADLFLSAIKEFLEDWDETKGIKALHTPEGGYGGVW